jgi:hypothetical protein
MCLLVCFLVFDDHAMWWPKGAGAARFFSTPRKPHFDGGEFHWNGYANIDARVGGDDRAWRNWLDDDRGSTFPISELVAASR